MAVNASYMPSPMDLVMVVPRLAHRIGSFALSQLPEQIDSVVDKIRVGGSVIAEATANATNATVTDTSSAFLQATSSTAAALPGPIDDGFISWLTFPLSFDSVRSLGGMFGYFGSRWALATFTVSIFLNRTQFYASSRTALHFKWGTRFLLYLVPMVLLLVQTLWVLQGMKCQTSPDYALLRYGDPKKNLSINFGGDGGFIHRLASTFLFWQTDVDSCAAMDMALVEHNKMNVLGSFAIVWPFFVTLCISQFVETLSCALQGRQPLPETGMTTFEHSLAFAECEAMISNALGLGLFGASNKDKVLPDTGGASGASVVLLTRSMILRRLNVPSEVLLIAFISCLSHLSSAFLAVTGHRQRFRLVNTGVWALCYMSAFAWSFLKVASQSLGDSNDLGILRFPTVCIIGFIPHLLILVGISVCACIYGLALLVTAISLPPDAPPDPSLKERFVIAYRNLQANVQFSSSSSIKLDWQEDFYTTLLKLGFNVLTAASEAVYLNEGNRIRISPTTWLEEKRIEELSSRASSRRKLDAVPADLRGSLIAKGVAFTDDLTYQSQSGYARERKSKTKKGKQFARLDDGLGLVEERGRWQLLVQFFNSIFTLLTRLWARFAIHISDKLGIQRRPAWLVRAADMTESKQVITRKAKQGKSGPLDFWLVSDDGSFSLPMDDNVDVEAETRRRLRDMGANEEAVDSNLYSWWKSGGWWGDVDTSGDFTAHDDNGDDDDDDTTSVISMSTNAGSDNEDASDSGRRTPTQDEPFPPRFSRDTTPDRSFGVADLARLLDPKTPGDREEAQLLARHLQSERPLTRAQYRRRLDRDSARILPFAHATSEVEEERALEQFILERRAPKPTAAGAQLGGSWDSGAEGMGSGGPQCVVCQSSPRVIMVWPCGCLSVCDDCRVGVAARNFANCLCCRTDVVAYSRLYVP